MSLPRVRLTVGRMMGTVALVALLLGLVVRMEHRSARFRGLVRRYELEGDPARAAKYDRAARYPRLPVSPDPPEPR
jgi:hypothetical protein